MKKIVSLLVLICFIVAFATPTTASANSNLSSEIVIITPDSFEQVFGANSIDDVFYEYQLEVLQENDSKASVALEIILTINSQAYSISDEGIVNSYELNNNDILWEGPIDSSLYINGERYIAIIGFTQLASSQESMISLTIQKDSTLVAISFGDDLINGSVLDFFLENIENDNSSITNIDNNISNSQFNELNPEDTYSPNAPPSQFSPIMDPGGGGGSSLNLGENGEWVYQSSQTVKHANNVHNALKSGVYFNFTLNTLMVMIKLYPGATQNYAENLGFDVAHSSLDSFGVQLLLDTTEQNHWGYIASIDIPSAVLDINNSNSPTEVYLIELFEEIISNLGFPTTLLSVALDNISGDVTSTLYSSIAGIDVKMPGIVDPTLESLDDVEPGLPFEFVLTTGDNSSYTGNTPYTVSTYVNYCILTQTNTSPTHPTYHSFYVRENTTHEGVITIQ